MHLHKCHSFWSRTMTLAYLAPKGYKYRWSPLQRHYEEERSFERRTTMAQLQMRRRANRVTYFVTVQTIALLGWIIVQSIFSLTLGNQLPFALTIIVEGVWWAATLVIMFFLFRREYDGFAQAVIDLEDANRKL